MIAVFKRTIVYSFTVTLVFISTVSCSLAFAEAAPDATNSHSKVREIMNVSDIIYYAPEPAKVELTEETSEVTPEPEPEPILEETYEYYEESYQEKPSQEDTYQDEFYNADLSSRGIYIAAGEQVSPSDFYTNGLYHDDDWSYTYYPESVLPGGGLDIPGRHVDNEGYICDENGYVCVASDDLEKGTVVSLPFGSGTGVVYDKGSGSGNLDIYTSWP